MPQVLSAGPPAQACDGQRRQPAASGAACANAGQHPILLGRIDTADPASAPLCPLFETSLSCKRWVGPCLPSPPPVLCMYSQNPRVFFRWMPEALDQAEGPTQSWLRQPPRR